MKKKNKRKLFDREKAEFFLISSLVHLREQEAAFRKVVQATMVRDRQHGPVVELNRIQVRRVEQLKGFPKFFILSYPSC